MPFRQISLHIIDKKFRLHLFTHIMILYGLVLKLFWRSLYEKHIQVKKHKG